MRLKMHEIKKMIDLYGEDKTLGEMLSDYNLNFTCPKCNGIGTFKKRVVTPYPSGLPDSGYVPPRITFEPIDCDLCCGQGYTKKEYKPKMVQDGWE